MAQAFSDYLENKLLDHTLRNVTYTAATTVYTALFTSTATTTQLEQGTYTNEVTGGSYARQASTFAAAASGATSNSAQLSWSNMPAATVAYVAICDTSTANTGNVLYWGALTANKTLNSGDTFIIATNDLDVSLD